MKKILFLLALTWIGSVRGDGIGQAVSNDPERALEQKTLSSYINKTKLMLVSGCAMLAYCLWGLSKKTYRSFISLGGSCQGKDFMKLISGYGDGAEGGSADFMGSPSQSVPFPGQSYPKSLANVGMPASSTLEVSANILPRITEHWVEDEVVARIRFALNRGVLEIAGNQGRDSLKLCRNVLIQGRKEQQQERREILSAVRALCQRVFPELRYREQLYKVLNSFKRNGMGGFAFYPKNNGNIPGYPPDNIGSESESDGATHSGGPTGDSSGGDGKMMDEGVRRYLRELEPPLTN